MPTRCCRPNDWTPDRSALRRSRELLREKVAQTLTAFERQRVPGVEYVLTSVVGEHGELIMTWTPK